MQYPQAYLFIKKDGKAIDPKHLKALADGASIYISRPTNPESAMEERIRVMHYAASILSKDGLSDDTSVVVISCNTINEFLLMNFRHKLESVCWIDDKDSFGNIDDLVGGYFTVEEVSEHARDLIETYQTAHDYVSKHLTSRPLGDDDLLKHVGVLANKNTALQDSIKIELRAATRQGILNRIDLQ